MTTNTKDITELVDQHCSSIHFTELDRLLKKLDYEDLDVLHALLEELTEKIANLEDDPNYTHGWDDGYEYGYEAGKDEGYERYDEGYSDVRRQQEVKINSKIFCSFFILILGIFTPSFISTSSGDIGGVFVSEQQEEITCLTNTLFAEARSEPEAGIRAVMSVIYNRKLHKDYPSSFCGVILQPKQFSAFNNSKELAKKRLKPLGAKDKQAHNLVSYVAHQAVVGSFRPVLDRDVLFYAQTGVRNKWTKKFTCVKVIHRHSFYKEI